MYALLNMSESATTLKVHVSMLINKFDKLFNITVF
jgi:hypothetical protein